MSTKSQQPAIEPNENFEYYRGDVYWNNFEEILSYMNLSVTGSAKEDWFDYVRRRYGKARRIFVPNCGNGWVERKMIGRDMASSAVGTDIAQPLLDSASDAARQEGLLCEYIKMDCNDFLLNGLEFDWIVNYAAFHHIAYLDKALRAMLQAMPEDGLLIGYDYTGPHRNQYSWKMWQNVLKINASLPPDYRADLIYPHQKTMIATDPTEAIHSELILEYVSRYFDFIELSAVGGCVAYPILYKNQNLFDAQQSPDGTRLIREIIEADRAFTNDDPHNSLFNFWIAKPKKRVLLQERQLALWTREEDEREQFAANNNGRYYQTEALELIYDEIADLNWKLRHGQRI